MGNDVIRAVAPAAFLIVAIAAPAHAETMVASFLNVSDRKFTIQTAAPKDKILDFTACKGVWFAAQKNIPTISFGKPVFGQAKTMNLQGAHLKVPDNWPMVTAVVYVKDPNPDGNRLVNVTEQAAICRQSWDWYQ